MYPISGLGMISLFLAVCSGFPKMVPLSTSSRYKHNGKRHIELDMLPLTLLNAAQGRTLDIECKSGRNYSGKMKACDLSMSVTLEEASCTSAKDGERESFPELYIRGSSIKYIRVPDELLSDIVEERRTKREEMYGSQQNLHQNFGNRGGKKDGKRR